MAASPTAQPDSKPGEPFQLSTPSRAKRLAPYTAAIIFACTKLAAGASPPPYATPAARPRPARAAVRAAALAALAAGFIKRVGLVFHQLPRAALAALAALAPWPSPHAEAAS